MTRVAENVKEGKDIFCAIDLHQEKMLAGIAVDQGLAEYQELDTREEGGQARLVKLLQRLGKAYPGARIRVCYEASGSGFRLADALEAAGFWVAVLAPTHLPSSPKQRSNKTDKRDVVRLLEVLRGHVLAGNSLPAVWKPPVELREDREVVRRRLGLGEKIAGVKNEIHGLLRRYGRRAPEEIKSPWTKKHVRWLERVAGELPAGGGSSLEGLLRELRFYLEELLQGGKAVAALSGEERYRKQVEALVAIPGVAVLTAMVFLTELGDLSRFGNRRALGSYLGLVPRAWESGERSDRKGHISKMGSARVRKVLNQASWGLVRLAPDWREWFKQRMRGQKPGRKKALIVGVMRQLGIRMWHLAQAAA
jgi:transposase